MANIEAKTVILFVINSRASDRVRFVRSSQGVCWSAGIGWSPNGATITCGFMPPVGAIMREIGHVLGLHHEMRCGDASWIAPG